MTRLLIKNQGSGSHSGNMVGNHKDVMETLDKNPNSGSHTGNMSGNHKDVMGTAAAPSAGGKNSPATQPAPASKPN
jgi:UDP-2,3-diacylglucosamine pyrophosphatase LpxH